MLNSHTFRHIFATLLLTLTSQSVLAQSSGPSTGCDFVNNIGTLFSNDVGTAEDYFAGDRITVTASAPTDGEIPQQIILDIDVGSFFRDADFPGTVSYTFPTDGEQGFYLYGADVDGFKTDGRITWNLSCTPAPASTPAAAVPIFSLHGLGALFVGILVIARRRFS